MLIQDFEIFYWDLEIELRKSHSILINFIKSLKNAW